MSTALTAAPASNPLSPRIDRNHVDRILASHLEHACTRASSNPHLGPLLRRAAHFVLEGGKRTRPRLCLASFRVISGELQPSAPVFRVAAALELFHAFMLVHDDLIDNSTLRRDRLTLHEAIRLDLEAHGADRKQACDLGLVAGDLLGTVGHRLLARSGVQPNLLTRIQRFVADMLMDTGLGEALDVLYNNTPLDELTEEHLVDAYLRKTARYSVAGPLGLGAMLAGARPKLINTLIRFGDWLGLSYQLLNDLEPFERDPALGGEHADLDAGKRTWILWKANQLMDEAERIAFHDALSDSVGPARRIRLWRLIRGSGALDAAREQIDAWREAAVATLETAPLRIDQKQAILGLIGLLPGSARSEHASSDLSGKVTA